MSIKFLLLSLLIITNSMNIKSENHIDHNFLNSHYVKQHFKKIPRSIPLYELYSKKFDFELKNGVDYYFFEKKIDELYIKVENNKVMSFMIALDKCDNNFMWSLSDQYGKPSTITFIDITDDVEFKKKFLNGNIKNNSDIEYDKISFCHWYVNELVISYNNFKESEIFSRGNKIEITFYNRNHNE